MREGFHVYMDDQDKLARAIVGPEQTRWLEPTRVADSLIDFIEYDFTSLWVVIDALYELPVFGEYMDFTTDDFESTLDVDKADLVDCQEYCRDIAEELEDPVGSFFICRELDKIGARADNGYASFWLEQARDMVESLRTVIYAHTFISRAFDTCFGESGEAGLPNRARRFFNEHPDLDEHVFAEVFAYLPQKSGRLNYEHALQLTRELGADFDRYYSALHEKKNSLSIVKGYLMRSHKELLFFSFLELLRRDIRIQRCGCCGGYFVPRTKKMTLYCDRVVRDGKTCKVIGPKLTQRRYRDLYKPLQEYERLYKMYYARTERYEGRFDLNRKKTPNDLTEDEFYTWSAKAASARRRYIAGELPEDKFLLEIALDERDLRLDLINLEQRTTI